MSTLKDIFRRIDSFDPIAYQYTRNYTDGGVSRLSPYISRGVINTRMVMERILARGYNPVEIEKFLQELAWRDYYQQIWVVKGDRINQDMKHVQKDVCHHLIPEAILNASTGIEAIDEGIRQLWQTGYMHNHVRMYVAFLACNAGKSHWKLPARWMYYYLLDGDWASNALSWQWVAGAFSNKKYVANQENINKYCHTRQKNTFLDVSYEEVVQIEWPAVLRDTLSPVLEVKLPYRTSLSWQDKLPLLIYNSYNLDPAWKLEMQANRILLLEPSHFRQHPVSGKVLDFILKIADEIEGIQVYVGEFDQLIQKYQPKEVYYKEHPLNGHYKGIEEPREWMFDVKGYYPSFFSFWKQCKKSYPFKSAS